MSAATPMAPAPTEVSVTRTPKTTPTSTATRAEPASPRAYRPWLAARIRFRNRTAAAVATNETPSTGRTMPSNGFPPALRYPIAMIVAIEAGRLPAARVPTSAVSSDAHDLCQRSEQQVRAYRELHRDLEHEDQNRRHQRTTTDTRKTYHETYDQTHYRI